MIDKFCFEILKDVQVQIIKIFNMIQIIFGLIFDLFTSEFTLDSRVRGWWIPLLMKLFRYGVCASNYDCRNVEMF